MKKFYGLFLVILFFSFAYITAGEQQFKLIDFYSKVQSGEWVMMESSQGIETLTLVVEKKDDTVTLDVKNSEHGQLLAVSRQYFSLKQNRFLEMHIQQDGQSYIVQDPHNEIDQLMTLPLKKMGEDIVKTRKGRLKCMRYRGVYQDHVVDVWTHADIPILSVAKIATQMWKIKVQDWGNTGVKAFYVSE